jgi:tRNA (guanine26-N2/guanine27-N2)-dimethyltransferase
MVSSFCSCSLSYAVSQSHCNPDAVKTDAPQEVLWDVLRCWVKKNPINAKRKKGQGKKGKDGVDASGMTIGNRILSKEPKLEADFTVPSELRRKKVARAGIARYPHNPEENWGPKALATNVTMAEKKARREGGGEGGEGGESKDDVDEPAAKIQRVDTGASSDAPLTQVSRRARGERSE